jgi:DNA-binding NtrC family response regulator
VPPLRERREDIGTLANFFLRTACLNRLDRDELTFDKDVMDCFSGYSWPGNVRELKNVVQRAATLAESSQITLRELPVNLMPDHSISRRQKLNSTSLRDHEKTLILQSLQECCGNISLAAIHLGVGRTTLYRRLKRYGIERVWKTG